MKIRKWLATALAALLVAGGVSVATALPASAHTGDLNVTYTCDTATGEYVGTATLNITQTNLKGETRWRVGNETFQEKSARLLPSLLRLTTGQ